MPDTLSREEIDAIRGRIETYAFTAPDGRALLAHIDALTAAPHPCLKCGQPACDDWFRHVAETGHWPSGDPAPPVAFAEGASSDTAPRDYYDPHIGGYRVVPPVPPESLRGARLRREPHDA